MNARLRRKALIWLLTLTSGLLSGCSSGGGGQGGGTPPTAATSDYVAGYIQTPGGSNISGVTVEITFPDNSVLESTTGSNGYYYFGNLTNSTYLVIPLLSGTGFEPPFVSSVPMSNDFNFQSFQVTAPLYGLDFSPYLSGQSPDEDSQISLAQLRTLMSIVRPYTGWVRSYAMDSGLGNIGSVAHEFGLKSAINAWLSTNLASNTLQMNALISAAQAGQVDLAIVGSEVLLRGDLTSNQLMSYIDQFRSAVPNVPVTTADEHNQLIQNPEVVADCDVVLVNYYPYWEGVSLSNAVAAVEGWQKQIQRAAGAKQVIVSETGWPSGGNAEGSAIPSPTNAAYYFQDFISWAKSNQVSFFYFEAFDEAWKAAAEGPQGAYWGIWDENGNMKPGMQTVFDGQLLPDNWSGKDIPGGAGTASLTLTYVPPYGSYNSLQGQALHVSWTDNYILVYLYVDGGWWVKPTFATPLTPMEVDGTWTCDVTTGGEDEDATGYAVYVVPYNYSPPLLSGDASLPAELNTVALAQAMVMRNP